jgi:hypothetical protein
MCALIRAECPGTNLHAPNGLQVSRLDERCCEELFETGFRTIRLSFEGSDGRTAAASSGKVSEADFERAARNLTRAGYDLNSIETYILAGLPGQTAADAARSIDFVKGLGCRPKLAEFSPIPGTRAFTEAAARNPAIISEPLLQNNTTYAQYLGGGITPSELQELKDRTRVHLDMEGLLSHCRPAR